MKCKSYFEQEVNFCQCITMKCNTKIDNFLRLIDEQFIFQLPNGQCIVLAPGQIIVFTEKEKQKNEKTK